MLGSLLTTARLGLAAKTAAVIELMMPTLVVLASVSLASLLLALAFIVTTPDWNRNRVFCFLLIMETLGFLWTGPLRNAPVLPILPALERDWQPDPPAGLRDLETDGRFIWPPRQVDTHWSRDGSFPDPPEGRMWLGNNYLIIDPAQSRIRRITR